MHKKILIFTHSSNGHYPEYVHHLYTGICDRPELEAVFVVPESFRGKMSLFHWPECPRIRFDYADNDKVGWGDGIWYKRNLRISLALRPFVRKHVPDEVFMIDPMICMPFLPFVMPFGIKISGILYGIYLYRWNELSKARKAAELFWHFLLAKLPCFRNVFVLNDAESAEHFNRAYHSNHFRYLPDPFMPLPEPEEDFREKYGIEPDRRIFFHFGSFGVKKGTLEILKSIPAMPEEQQKHSCFVFAGCIQGGIRHDFDILMEAVRQTQAKCLVFNEYCSFEFLAGWCKACDAVLVPYLMAYNSSGCIGYAAQFHKPVIGPGYGLLGKLIRKYTMGIALQQISPETLSTAYFSGELAAYHGDEYLLNRDAGSFCKAILD